MKKIIFILLIVLCTIKIDDCSAQWEPDVRLSDSPFESRITYSATCMASIGNEVHMVWFDKRDGNYEIYYKRSTNGGSNWEADKRLTNNTAVSQHPSLAISGQILHVVWSDFRDGNYEIYYKQSTDGGSNWGTDIRLTNATASSGYPCIVLSGQVLHMVWRDVRDGNNEIYYKRSTDGGSNWEIDTRLTNDTSRSVYPVMAVSGSVVHVAWHDERDGNEWNDEIYYKRSTDGGISWGADIRLTNAPSYSEDASIAVSGSFVHLIWTEYRDADLEIYYKRSTDGGISWGADIRLTNTPGYSFYTSVAVSGSVVHVVWEEYRDGNHEIYYKRSLNSGSNWGTDIRLTNNSAASYYPKVSVTDSVVHVAWEDYRDGNWGEIYYKRNTSGNLTGIIPISSETPKEYKLLQNYPNPFNPSTKIRFDVVMDSRFRGNDKVVLKVYDVMGREVTTLVNERMQPGTYSVDWNASSFPSGIYFYRLTTERFSAVKKMMLVK